MVTTKINWSGPNCDFLPKWITFGPDQFILVVTISFWSWPNHSFQIQINLVRPKPFWTDQNCFGHIEGQDIRPYFFHFSLHSLSMGPIHYRISWETTGPLSRDSTGDHPKEVIGDILMSSKASVNLWHPVLMIHLGLYFMSSSYNF